MLLLEQPFSAWKDAAVMKKQTDSLSNMLKSQETREDQRTNEKPGDKK
jgi:hypothetical protein